MDGRETWRVNGTEGCETVGGVETCGVVDGTETCRAKDANCCEIWARMVTDCCW